MDIEKELQTIKDKATPLSTAKFIVGTLISCGAMAAIAGAMKPALGGTKGVTKLMIRLGIFILSCKGGDIAEKYFSDTVDDILKSLRQVKEETDHEPAAA